MDYRSLNVITETVEMRKDDVSTLNSMLSRQCG
ncbi:hypothetical protein T4E_11362 [Trichinella pseudospiralis]|uniref:Uncharacterized protein n=1 Tax=Trichinella pseudospiralis TaxID=6337 RepID=A0A0V0YL06_TRIPS|nr:hypothetical protein T4E_11362 [Trichinella pseudospiralis]